MFGLFKKKEEKPKRGQNTQEQRFKDFAAQFRPEELSVLAVTGANGFSGGKTGAEELWQATIGLTAWMEEDSPDVHRGEFQLTTLADDQLLDFLRQRAYPDFIIKFRARVSEDGRRLLLLNLPESGFDPDLKAVLDEQKKPVTFWEEGLGTFTLNRQVNWFETEADWLGTPVQLTFDRDDSRTDCADSAKALLAGASDWDARVRAFAADELLSLANDWAEDGEESPEVTREQFMQRMELESVQIGGDGSLEFWFSDGDMFYGHSIHVTGSLKDGPDRAQMEG